MFQNVGQYSHALMAMSEKRIERFVGKIKAAVIFGQIFAVMMIGFLVAGGVASFFYFEALTLDKTLAAMYVAAEFLVLALLTGIGYSIARR